MFPRTAPSTEGHESEVEETLKRQCTLGESKASAIRGADALYFHKRNAKERRGKRRKCATAAC